MREGLKMYRKFTITCAIMLLSNIPGLVSESNSVVHEVCSEDIEREPYVASPLVPCQLLDVQFIECEDVTQLRPTNTTDNVYCSYFGTSKGPLLYIDVKCRALLCIECAGPRTFTRSSPCVKFTNHYFITALLYSTFLGVFAIDRAYLGYSAIAVGKLMTLGGLGVWWIADIVLLLTGNLMPANESEWQPYY